jgi:hypothetical protein
MNRIYKEDSAYETAVKIFEDMELHASCCISGFLKDGDEIISKGEEVLRQLEKLDTTTNVTTGGRRKRKKIDNTIGDYVAQKTWRWDKKIVDNQVRITIWRIQ